MDPINYGLESPRILGMLQPKREMLDNVDPGAGTSAGPVPQLQTPKRGETVSASGSSSVVKASQHSHFSAFTPTHGDHHDRGVTHLQAMTPVTTLFSDYSTPKSEHERSIWADVSLTPETPGRKTMVERTVLADRLAGSSPFCLTPERQPLDFMSPDRDRRDSGRRGRPRADMVNNLIISGAQSGNPIKCKICSRDFPREKSLQAHLRTHTGERPYTCDYPNCTRAFVQSGQLKTHQRLHAGEKPFKCPVSHCTNRYTHANRFCPDHPGVKPKRSSEIILQPVISAAEDQEAVYAWLERYKRDREEKTPGKAGEGGEEELVSIATPRRHQPGHEVHPEASGAKLRTKRGLASEMEQALGQENVPSPPRPVISRSEILRTTLTTHAHQSLNQALLRAAERSQPPASESLTDFRPYLDTSPAPAVLRSPAKSLRKSLEESSPMRGIRRTLGEITPSKNCKVDNVANLDYDLPFPLDLNTLPGGFERLQPLPMTPLPAEKCLSPAKSSPPMIGSPAIKLKKRFQERFQEEKQQEDDLQALARPILWQEEDAAASARSGSTPVTPLRRDRQDSASTFLVAAALMELHQSPTRAEDARDLPLNLTKK